jgi:nucleoside-diphosphate kinase
MAIQRTLVLIKPDAVKRGLIGAIVQRFEAKGLTLAGLRLLRCDKATAEAHYVDHKAKPFFPGLIAFITGSPLVALALQGDEAVAVVRNLMGATDGRKAAPGTVRGDFGCSIGANLVHGSDSAENAAKELAIWFPGGAGLYDWERADQAWLDA